MCFGILADRERDNENDARRGLDRLEKSLREGGELIRLPRECLLGFSQVDRNLINKDQDFVAGKQFLERLGARGHMGAVTLLNPSEAFDAGQTICQLSPKAPGINTFFEEQAVRRIGILSIERRDLDILFG